MSSAQRGGEVMSSVEKEDEAASEVEPGSLVTYELEQGAGMSLMAKLQSAVATYVSLCSINMETDLTSYQHFPLNTAANPERKSKC
ncbi:hypothetical protein KOW79_004375 [Hemibagrus wyckioides]|uniref:Uncharacterized protein n=1 Tax=Hemibagrus wyckioides TaxID=337641 RepID=A0A9D3SPM5_9TELE|nr:hypothetical protein KOW79_004375 [Hemibagrus wyckioides]